MNKIFRMKTLYPVNLFDKIFIKNFIAKSKIRCTISLAIKHKVLIENLR